MAISAALPLIHRRVIRGQENPLDRATVVSIYPRPLDEYKYTLFPGRWTMNPGSYDKPEVLTVGPSSWFFDKDEESPIVEIPVGALQIAESIVKDYAGAVLEATLGECQPGLFFLPGTITSAQVKTDHKARLDHANQLQKNWYLKLVKVADSLWARSNGNPIAISDDMRMAATELHLVDKPWLQDYHAVAMVKCFACGNLRNPEYPICPSCKYIDQTHPRAKDLKFAV